MEKSAFKQSHPTVQTFVRIRHHKATDGQKHEPKTWVLLQAEPDIIIVACSPLSAVVSADGMLLGFYFLFFTFKPTWGSGTGQDIINIPPAAIPER
jgi:hypothetical protein